MIQLIGRGQVVTTGREDHHVQQASHQAVREVLQQIVDCLFRFIQCILHTPVNQRQVRFMTAFVVVTFQNRRGQIQLAQYISQTSRYALAAFETSAQHSHRHVRE